MENKYQEALDWLKTRENWNGMCYEELQVDIRYDEKFKTLQELIDLYTNESKYESFAEIYKDHQEEIAKLEKELNDELNIGYELEGKVHELERALDIACKKYADMKDKYRIDYLKQGCVETRWCNWEKVKANILKELESEK